MGILRSSEGVPVGESFGPMGPSGKGICQRHAHGTFWSRRKPIIWNTDDTDNTDIHRKKRIFTNDRK